MADVIPSPNVLHVYPLGDLIEHELIGDDCVCGVTVQPVPQADGSMRWLHVHHSLDGRELAERTTRDGEDPHDDLEEVRSVYVSVLWRVALLLGYLSTIVSANWAVAHFGLVPVGFGLLAPAGVYLAGLAFTLRDLLHDAAGRRAVLVAIALGTFISIGAVPTRLALSAGVAFCLSELADLAVYEPMRRRGWLRAVLTSNIVGLVVDSALFLWLAFGSLAFVPGQIVGKAWMTLLAVAVLAGGRRLWRARLAT